MSESESQIHVKLILVLQLFLKCYSYWDVHECARVQTLYLHVLFIRMNVSQRSPLKGGVNYTEYALVIYFKSKLKVYEKNAYNINIQYKHS